MSYFTRSDSIGKLGLSTRSYNALRQADVHTVGNLLDYPKDDIGSIKNMGAKSVDEIISILEKLESAENGYHVKEEPEESADVQVQTFMGADGQTYEDISIEEIGLSNRAYHCLKHAGIDFASQLLQKSDDDLLDLPNMGTKSVADILKAKARIIFQPIAQAKNDDEVENILSADGICRAILKGTIGKVNVHAGKLYEEMYPFCEDILRDYPEKYVNLSSLLTDSVFISQLCAVPFLRDTLKEVVLTLIEKEPYGIEKEFVSQAMPQYFNSNLLVGELLQELLSENKIICDSDGQYLKQYPSALEYAQSLIKPQHCMVLMGRIKGKTLEEIGQELNISRERIRQIEAKCLKAAPVLKEDQYAEVYKKYNISKQDFHLGFRESAEVYNYLSIAYKHGNTPVEEMINDTEFPIAFRKAAERIAFRNYFVLGNERVLCRRAELCEYVLRTVGADGITFEEFSQMYLMLLDDLGLQDDPKFSLMERGYENKLAASDHVLWKQGKKLRYYNIYAYDFTELFDELNLNQYTDIEYSALKFFRTYPELMNTYDIRDEYELHNLLKKICTKDDFPSLTFKRMPILEFGTADRDNQVMELLITHAPIANIDFAQEYENEYGVRANTVLANFMKNFDQYFYNGIYKIDFPMLSEIMLAQMKKALPCDFYSLSDIKNVYVQEFPQADKKLLNPYTLKSLGFRVYSNYAVRDTYSSAVDYFRTLLTLPDIVDARSFQKELLNTVAYSSELYKQKAVYEILEFAPLKYVNIRRLIQAGIPKEGLYVYCRDVFNAVDEGKYFTVYSLRSRGFDHRLDDLGFDEWFYASLLSEDKEHFSYCRMGKNKLFKKGNGDVLLSDFIESILYSQESLSMDIYDLVDYLREEYNIDLDFWRITETIKGSSMYYDSIMDRVYADYDVYFEEV